ncbi:MAG: LysR family transcriptional regulator [Thermoanaerobacteraceae bacterium]|nr:LysR family transcriptional regulator [Thermoanaerobacteraceae bacterium]
MELRQLEYFYMVSKLKNFTHAAEKLHVSQPSVTNSINKLEEELGVQLLDRNTKRVSLTSQGKIFFKRVEKILQGINEAVSEIKNFDKGTIKLGLPPIIGAYLFPSIFLEFKKVYPYLELQVFEEGSLSTRTMLEKGQLDLGIIILPDHSEILNTIPLINEQIVVCLPPNHRLSQEKIISFSQLSNEKFILLRESYFHRKAILNECLKHGFSPNIVFSSNQIETVKALVASSIGISFLMCMAVNDNQKIIKVPLAEPIEISIGLAWKKDKHLSKASKTFIDFVRNYFSTIPGCK